MRNLLSPHDILYFQTIARLKSLRLAAAELHVTQPGLSHALKRLESELGVSLFERTPKGLKTTADGRRLLELSQSALHSWRELRNEFRSDGTDPTKRRLRMGLHVSVATYVAPTLLARLEDKGQISGFELIHGLSRDLVREVLEGSLEVALAMNPHPHPSLVIREVLTDRVRIFGTTSKTNHLIYDPQLAQSQWLLRAHAKLGQQFTTHSHTGSLEVIRALAEAGVGAAILPERVAKLAKRPLKPLFTDGPSYKDRLCIVTRPHFARSEFGKAIAAAVYAANE